MIVLLLTCALNAPSPHTVTLYEGTVIAGSEQGLYRAEGERWVPIELGLEGPQRRIRTLAVLGDDLYVGTAAGLIRVVVTSCGHRLEPVLSGPTLGMSSGAGQLTVTTAAGAFIVKAGGRVAPLEMPAGWTVASR